MPKIISPKRLGSALDEIIREFDHLSQAKANRGIRKAVIRTWADIIKATPVGVTGRARGNWFIDSAPTRQTGKGIKNKGSSYVTKQTAKRDLLKGKLFLFNNIPYIRKLEYGGYSTKNANSEDSKVTSKGFSKQTPKGMVRVNLLKWRKNLRKSFAGLG